MERSHQIFPNSHINRTAEIFIMSTFSLYRRDSNYQRMAPPSTIYEVNQWKSSKLWKPPLSVLFWCDQCSQHTDFFFPLFFLTTSTSWIYVDWYSCIHSISYEFGTLLHVFIPDFTCFFCVFIRNSHVYLQYTKHSTVARARRTRRPVEFISSSRRNRNSYCFPIIVWPNKLSSHVLKFLS